MVRKPATKRSVQCGTPHYYKSVYRNKGVPVPRAKKSNKEAVQTDQLFYCMKAMLMAMCPAQMIQCQPYQGLNLDLSLAG